MGQPALDLQNGWYNGFTQGMGLSIKQFQLLQPASPLVSSSQQNQMLWSYLNNIPPFSLTQKYTPSGGNQFYSNYSGMLSALQPATTIDLKADIGDENYNNWMTYLQSRNPLPTPSQLPSLFYSWASIFAPSVANIGRSDYNSIALDPIASAQTQMNEVYNAGRTPPNWSLNYDDLLTQLRLAPNRSFNFNSQQMDSNTSSSWTSGGNSAVFGLWGGSSSSSSISTKFYSSAVTVSVSFDHVLTFAATPGQWYSSSAMGLAYSNKTGRPWREQSAINWDNTFGNNGNLQRFMVNLVVASGMRVTVVSDATYTSEEQSETRSHSHSGFWPFYSGGDSHSTSNDVKFNEHGHLEITTTSLPGVPIMLGGNVQPVQQFVGQDDKNLLMSMYNLLATT